MRRGLVCFLFLLARLAAAEDSLHVYYYGGESIEQINIGGVTVTLRLKDNGKLNQVAVYVDNRSPDAVNLIPANFTLHQNTPKDKDLAMKSDQQVQKIGGDSALGQVVSGVGTGLRPSKRQDDRKRRFSLDKRPSRLRRAGTMAGPRRRTCPERANSHAGALVSAQQFGVSGHKVGGCAVVRSRRRTCFRVVHVTLGSRN